MNRTVSTPHVNVECGPRSAPAFNPPERQILTLQDGPAFLTVTEVSELLRIPQGTLRYWRHAGIGPRSVRFGRRVVYRSNDIRMYIESESPRTSRGEDPIETV